MCAGETVPSGAAAVPTVVFATPIGSRQGEQLQEGPAADGRKFAKQGLWVRSDVAATIVAQSPTDGVDFQGWGDDKVHSAVDIPALPAECVSWRVYPGGLVYSESQCAQIRVTAGGRSGTLNFGLGVRC
jgi:hypothetical protein